MGAKIGPRYFLPWWPSDYIWREWTVEDDLRKDPAWTKGYLWEIMPNVVDGILVSRWPLSPKRVKTLRGDLRFNGIIIGDSGAHSYRALDDPPYSCHHLLEFYAQGEFDYGMTLDVVAAPWVRPGGLSDDELECRLQRTVENAERCLELQARFRYPVELIGVVQGWDPQSYQRCAHDLLQLGFKYLAVAGQRNLTLLKASLLGVLEEIRATKDSIRLHVLGTGSPKILPFYVAQGISSFDSATWFRQAWLSNAHNYFMVQGTEYCSFRATRVGLGELDVSGLTWTGNVDCDCKVCLEMGQQVLLYRGRQRNFRRGFHNVYQYVKLLKMHKDHQVIYNKMNVQQYP
jgi:tRNA-guanine family transglycosylase